MESTGIQNECSSTAFTIISIDNIDFLHGYAKVFCGDKKCSWHGTTIQLVQPKLTSLNEYPASPQDNCQTAIHNSTNVLGQQQNSPVALHRRRKHDVDRLYASPPSKSPVPKIQRRARTAMEAHKLAEASRVPETIQVHEPSMRNTYHNMQNLSITDFKAQSCEIASTIILVVEVEPKALHCTL